MKLFLHGIYTNICAHKSILMLVYKVNSNHNLSIYSSSVKSNERCHVTWATLFSRLSGSLSVNADQQLSGALMCLVRRIEKCLSHFVIATSDRSDVMAPMRLAKVYQPAWLYE